MLRTLLFKFFFFSTLDSATFTFIHVVLEFNSKICNLDFTQLWIGGDFFAQNLKFYRKLLRFTNEQKKQQQQKNRKTNKRIQHKNKKFDVYV